MLRKILTSITLAALLLSLSACGKPADRLSVDRGDEPSYSSAEPEPVTYKNPLTGISGISKEKAESRPVAIMINNITTAQPVQTGLSAADIIYETEVEGGITRLLAVFQDVTAAEKVGSIRSARYPYVDLAMGHNAIYIHCGQDNTYCAPHLKDTDDVDLMSKNYGVRLKNGLASEHTLYVYGEKLWSSLVSDGHKTSAENTSWVNFADEDEANLLDGTAATVNIPASASYKTVFKYDAATGKYTRYFGNTVRKDYFTGEAVAVKNVFVLSTTIRNYADNYHREVLLEGGDGYYCTNGTYTPIKWSKGSASNGFKFTKADGSALKVSAGNSWVSLISTAYTPTFE